LTAFIVSRLDSVFILGRTVTKLDTDFCWGSGAPSGLLHDAWNVRLIPHYSLGVCSSSPAALDERLRALQGLRRARSLRDPETVLQSFVIVIHVRHHDHSRSRWHERCY